MRLSSYGVIILESPNNVEIYFLGIEMEFAYFI